MAFRLLCTATTMIPLIIPGAISIASDVIDAWKAHSQNVAAAKAVNSADFQQSLKTAATQLAANAMQQSQAAIPGEVQTTAKELLQAPGVQSMARTSPYGSVNLEFNSSGDVFASQANGAMRRIMVSPEVQQQLQQLNAAMRSSAAGAYGSVAHVSGQIASNHMPVQMNLAAV